MGTGDKQRFCLACEGQIARAQDVRDVCRECFKKLKRLERGLAKRRGPKGPDPQPLVVYRENPNTGKPEPVKVPAPVHVPANPGAVFLGAALGAFVGGALAAASGLGRGGLDAGGLDALLRALEDGPSDEEDGPPGF